MCSLVWAGFPVAPEGFNAVLGQLARWFYPFGSGAHCNNYYYGTVVVLNQGFGHVGASLGGRLGELVKY